MNKHDDEIHTLKETLIYELTKAFALPQNAWAKNIVRIMFGQVAQAAAEIEEAARRSLQNSMSWARINSPKQTA